MEVYKGMSGKELRDWRKANRKRMIEEMKKEEAANPLPELTPEEEESARGLLRSLLAEYLSQEEQAIL